MLFQGLRVGILRDLQQQNMKRTANLKNQQDQIELTKVLREKQAMEDAQRYWTFWRVLHVVDLSDYND